MVSELGSCANLHTQAETPATRYHTASNETPLRHKQSSGHLSSKFDMSAPTASALTGSRGRLAKASGERFSYAIGDGNYILLEEVGEPTPHQASTTTLIQARDLTKEFMAVDTRSSPVKQTMLPQ